MTKRIVLQIDGGGILGITPAIVLDELEKRIRVQTGKNDFLIRDSLALCCGTSTGAIMAGLVAAGVDAAKICEFYSVDGVNLFNNSKNPFYTRLVRPKFKRQPFLEKLNKILNENSFTKNAGVTLGELPKSVRLMVTAYNLCSHRTHFIKSHDKCDQSIQLRDAIAWSALSAACYFGKINVPDYKWKFMDNGTFTTGNTLPKCRDDETCDETGCKIGAVFQDGGQGTQNCTLDFVLTEILSRNWDSDEVIIISLGTGGHTKIYGYDVTKNISDLGQTIKYLTNQARAESTMVQILAARYVQKHRPNIQLFRLDYEAKADYSLDDTDHVDVYKQSAIDIIKSPIFDKLLKSVVTIVAEG